MSVVQKLETGQWTFTNKFALAKWLATNRGINIVESEEWDEISEYFSDSALRSKCVQVEMSPNQFRIAKAILEMRRGLSDEMFLLLADNAEFVRQVINDIKISGINLACEKYKCAGPLEKKLKIIDENLFLPQAREILSKHIFTPLGEWDNSFVTPKQIRKMCPEVSADISYCIRDAIVFSVNTKKAI